MTTASPNPIQHSSHLTEIAPDTFVDASGRQLTPKEVRNIVTPHDFAVNTALFGLPLARPWRRGCAVAIDGLLITLLAAGDLLFFTPLYGYLIWRCHKLGSLKRRNILLGLMPLLLVYAYAQNTTQQPTTDIDVSSAVELSAAAIKLASNCDAACADEQADSIILALQTAKLSDAKAQDSLQDLLKDSALSAAQQQQKLQMLQQRRAELSAARKLLQT
uniref:hypothetical protein n=1 Tax=Rheinheimera sp. TaxID=1869214 RepID=UPI0040472AFC